MLSMTETVQVLLLDVRTVPVAAKDLFVEFARARPLATFGELNGAGPEAFELGLLIRLEADRRGSDK